MTNAPDLTDRQQALLMAMDGRDLPLAEVSHQDMLTLCGHGLVAGYPDPQWANRVTLTHAGREWVAAHREPAQEQAIATERLVEQCPELAGMTPEMVQNVHAMLTWYAQSHADRETSLAVINPCLGGNGTLSWSLNRHGREVLAALDEWAAQQDPALAKLAEVGPMNLTDGATAAEHTEQVWAPTVILDRDLPQTGKPPGPRLGGIVPEPWERDKWHPYPTQMEYIHDALRETNDLLRKLVETQCNGKDGGGDDN